MRYPIHRDRDGAGQVYEGRPRRRESLGRRLLRRLGEWLLILVLLAGCVLGLNYVLRSKSAAFAEEMAKMEEKLEEALQLQESLKATDVRLEEKLSQIGELATSVFEYSGEKVIENTRQMMGINIPGTTNRVELVYEGVIKVGYDISLIEYQVDEASKLLRFDLPLPQVLDNYIKLDGLQCKDANNILNPIGSDDIIGYFADIEEEELKRAVDAGIYRQAEEKLQAIITNFMAAFPEYTVVFA